VTPSAHSLIRYGRLGYVGPFASELALSRGDHVVVRSPRGMELGEVLIATTHPATSEDGVVVRVATLIDEADAHGLEARGRGLLASATELPSGLPLSFVDVEVTLDGTAILHALAWEACDATPVLDELAARFGLAVRLLNLSSAPGGSDPTIHTGCGEEGCGKGSGCSTCGTGGGCSTGSCTRGAVKSADELTSYFAALRSGMEAAGMVRTPLN